MRAVITLWILLVTLAMSVPVQGDCICESHITPEALSEPIQMPMRGRAVPSSVTIELAGPNATTTADLILGPPPETSLTSGSMTLALTDLGDGTIQGDLTDLNATAAGFTMGTCDVGDTSWSPMPVSPGQLIFDYNNNTISGRIVLIVSGGVIQKHIDVTVTGTINPDAGPGEDLFVTTGTYTGMLNLPGSCSVPTTNPIGGAALGVTFVGLAMLVLRRRLV